MKIERFIGGMLESNGYVIYQKDGGNCYVIDPGYHAGVFEECIDRHQLHLSGILLTHHHYDHVGAVEKLRDRYDAPVFMQRIVISTTAEWMFIWKMEILSIWMVKRSG